MLYVNLDNKPNNNTLGLIDNNNVNAINDLKGAVNYTVLRESVENLLEINNYDNKVLKKQLLSIFRKYLFDIVKYSKFFDDISNNNLKEFTIDFKNNLYNINKLFNHFNTTYN